MIKEIPKPDFEGIVANWDDSGTLAGFNFNRLYAWFDMYVEPINKAIREGQVVGAEYDEDEGFSVWTENTTKHDTYRGLLIGVEKIKKESCADVLFEVISMMEKSGVSERYIELHGRAVAALANEED